MRARAILVATIALAWSSAALAQGTEAPPPIDDAAPADDQVATVEEESEPEPASEPIAPEPAQPATSQPATSPPATSSRPAPASTQSAAQQPVVIVNRRRHHEEEEEEPEPDHTPPDPYDIVYLELFGGPTYVDLRAIRVENYYPEFVSLKGVGGGGGVAAGFRVEFFSLGVRGSLSHYDVVSSSGTPSSFDVGTAAVEATLSLPLPVVRPFIRAGFGLGWHGDAGVKQVWTNMMAPTDIETTVFGWVFQGAIGLDVYVAEWFSLGAAFSVDVLNMSRHAWSDEPADLDPSGSTDVNFREPGDAIGVQGRGQIAATFHF